MIIDIDKLKTQLVEGTVRVEFIKLDGTHRSMECTKNFKNIPESQIPKGNSKKKPNDRIMGVFDLEKQQWRSITIDNIQSWVVVTA
jgi:hypothetical protein